MPKVIVFRPTTVVPGTILLYRRISIFIILFKIISISLSVPIYLPVSIPLSYSLSLILCLSPTASLYLSHCTISLLYLYLSHCTISLLYYISLYTIIVRSFSVGSVFQQPFLQLYNYVLQSLSLRFLTSSCLSLFLSFFITRSLSLSFLCLRLSVCPHVSIICLSLSLSVDHPIVERGEAEGSEWERGCRRGGRGAAMTNRKGNGWGSRGNRAQRIEISNIKNFYVILGGAWGAARS